MERFQKSMIVGEAVAEEAMWQQENAKHGGRLRAAQVRFYAPIAGFL
jgi:hypothetical protein